MARRLVLPAIAALALVGCGARVLDVEVNLVTKSCQSTVNPLEKAVVLRFTVFGDGIDSTVSQTSATLDTKGATIPSIPVGSARNIVAEALDLNSGVVARGETGPVDFSGKDTKASVTIYLRKVNAFDKATLASAPAGACSTLISARAGHTATLLENGKVLITGGYQPGAPDSTYLATTEIYDPQTGSVTQGPPLKVPRARHTATHIPGTKLTIIAGGEGSPIGKAAGALIVGEIYDEGANAFTDTRAMAEGRTRHTALVPLALANAKPTAVFISGGLDANGKALSSIEFFDATQADKGFQLPPPEAGFTISPGRGEMAGVGIPGGVVMFGGWGGLPSAATVFPKDIVGVNSPDGLHFAPFTTSGMTDGPHAFPMVARMTDGSVVVAGGFSVQSGGEPDLSKSIGGGVVFDSSLAMATPIPAITGGGTTASAPRAFGIAAGLLNNEVLIAGGGSGPAAANKDGFLVLRKNGAIQTALVTGPMADARIEAASVVLKDGTVLVTGGYNFVASKAAINSIEVYQPPYVVAGNEAH
jgi:hypothetical protein